MLHKGLKMFSGKVRSSPSQNHKQLLSKTMLQIYLKEVKRIKHLLDAKIVLPMYTCACEYFHLNRDKMHLFLLGEMHTFASLHSADSTGDAGGSRWHFLGPGILHVRQVQTTVKYSHLLASGSLCSSSLVFSCPEIQFCSMKMGPTHFSGSFTYIHSYKWFCFLVIGIYLGYV